MYDARSSAAASCQRNVMVGSGRGDFTIRFLEWATARTLYANCGILADFRYFGRRSHTGAECTFKAKMIVFHGVVDICARGRSV